MAIKCGNCKEYHDTVDLVKWCHKYQSTDTVRSHAPLAQKVVSNKPKVTEGFYRLDDDIIKVVKSQQDRLYAKKLVVFYDDNHTAPTKGVWEYVPGLMSKLDLDMALTKDEAAEFGQLYGVCAICGALLTNEESIERGIGPICFSKMGW